MYARLFTATNNARLAGHAWLSYLPIGLGVAAIMTASDIRHLGLSGFAAGMVLFALGLLVLSPVPPIRQAYATLVTSIFGDIQQPTNEQLRVASRKWILVWLLACGVFTVFFCFSITIPLSAAKSWVANDIVRNVVVFLWLSILFPVFFVGMKLSDLATLWLDMRTQGPRND
jgi:hypothetical protein